MNIKVTITKPSGTIISIEIPIDDDAVASQQPVVLESKPESVPEVSGKMEVKEEPSPIQEPAPSPVCEPESEPEPEPIHEPEIPPFVPDDNSTGLDQVEFPTDGDGLFKASAALVADFVTAFGEEHVRTEFQKAKCWLLTNPQKRKTQRGMGRFLNAWLCRNAGMQKAPIKQIVQNSFTTSGKQNSQGW